MTLNNAVKKPKLAPCYKTEFDKCRLIRLEQVRQQSRDLARKIRTKIQQRKNKDITELEKKKQMGLNVWKAKKLIEIQKQYENAVTDWGTGHKLAAVESENEEEIKEKHKENLLIAQERGQKAAEKLQEEKMRKENKKKQISLQRQRAKNLEKNQSSLRKTKAVNTENMCLEKGVQVENFDVNLMLDLDSKNTFKSNVDQQSVTGLESGHKEPMVKSAAEKPVASSIERVTSVEESPLSPSVRLPKGPASLNMDKPIELNTEKDTRISDLIKNRQRNRTKICKCIVDNTIQGYREIDVVTLDKNNADAVKAYQTVSNQNGNGYVGIPCCHKCTCLHEDDANNVDIDDNQDSSSKTPKLDNTDLNGYPCCKNCDCLKKGSIVYTAKKIERPIIDTSKVKNHVNEKPKLIQSKRIDTKTKKDTETTTSKARYYDKKNRFTKEYQPNIQIERLKDKDIISESLEENDDKEELMEQQKKKAEERGQKAMEKEMAQKAYNDLMKRLPLLKKQERVCECGQERPEHHMDTDRLREQEQRRQSKMEDVYKDIFPPVNVITMPKRQETDEPPRWSFREDTRDLNLAKPETSKNDLTVLLDRLRKQKSKLSQEIDELRNSKTSLHSDHGRKKRGSESLKSEKGKTSRRSSKTKADEKLKKMATKETQTRQTIEDLVEVEEIGTSTSSSSSNSDDSAEYKQPAKKPKYCGSDCKRKVLVLQNTSTQTTPQPTPQSSQQVVAQSTLRSTQPSTSQATSEKPSDAEQVTSSEKHLCSKVHVPCECVEKKVLSVGDSQCEILIKFKDAEKPEIVVIEKDEVDNKLPVADKQSVVPPEALNNLLEKRKSKTRKTNSWREQLNSYSTTTTSYLSPPSVIGSLQRISNRKDVDPRLLGYVKKLLTKSRTSIDRLTVSSSEVSTPSQSVIEIESNVNVRKIQNFRLTQLEQHSSESSIKSSSTSSIERSREFVEYSSIERSFNKKIDDINAMIHKVREEKKNMIRSPYSSDSEKGFSTTAYLDLNLSHEKNDEGKQDNDDQHEKEAEKKLTKQLLEIDLSYKKLLALKSPSKPTENKEKDVSPISDLDEEVMLRYRQLKMVEEPNSEPKIWLDIPKLAALEAPTTYKKHPPTSKGLLTAKKFNDDINVVPHELSTIAEGDSVMSKMEDRGAKKADENKSVPDVISEKSPNSSSTPSSDKSDLELTEAMLRDIGMDWAIPILRKTKQSLAASSSSSDVSGVKLSDVSKGEIASSSFKSDAKRGGDLLDFDNISEIKGPSDKKTSTPIQQGKSGDNFDDTDLSSIKSDKKTS